MMNWAHIHLLVNDVPMLASLFAALFFLIALRVEIPHGAAPSSVLSPDHPLVKTVWWRW